MKQLFPVFLGGGGGGAGLAAAGAVFGPGPPAAGAAATFETGVARPGRVGAVGFGGGRARERGSGWGGES